MNILDTILTIASLVWLPLSLGILWAIYHSNKVGIQRIQETLVMSAKRTHEQTSRSIQDADQLSTMIEEEGGRGTHSHEDEHADG